LSYKVSLSNDAENDIDCSFMWYEIQKPKLGYDLIKSIDKKLETVSRNPFAYPIVYKNIRRTLIKRFPFCIYYDVDNEIKGVRVIAVFHNSRNPLVWKKRK